MTVLRVFVSTEIIEPHHVHTTNVPTEYDAMNYKYNYPFNCCAFSFLDNFILILYCIICQRPIHLVIVRGPSVKVSESSSVKMTNVSKGMILTVTESHHRFMVLHLIGSTSPELWARPKSGNFNGNWMVAGFSKENWLWRWRWWWWLNHYRLLYHWLWWCLQHHWLYHSLFLGWQNNWSRRGWCPLSVVIYNKYIGFAWSCILTYVIL